MIRQPSGADADAIRELLDLAFHPSRYESRLWELVANRGGARAEWVVEEESRVVAHILYTPACDGPTAIGYHLGPVAVHPDFQKRGIGSALIRQTLGMDPLRESSIFVLGDPQFYQRFGFEETGAASCPFDEANEHFRALRWDDSSRSPFVIGYDSAFDESVSEDRK